MRIGIDARGLQRVPRGIPLYTKSLCEHLPAHLPGATLVLFTNDEFQHNVPRDQYRPALDQLVSRGPYELVNGDHSTEEHWEQRVLPRLMKKSGVDLVFMPGNRVPILAPAPVVATFHDVIERRFLGAMTAPAGAGLKMRFYFLRQRAYLRLMYTAGVRRAAHIVTGTEDARRDLASDLGIPNEKITVIHHGRDDAFLRAGGPLPKTGRLYTLMLGGDSSQKNADGAVEGWARVPGDIRRRYPLRVVGFAGKDSSPLIQALRRTGLEPDVQIEGWLSDQDIVDRFQKAAVFLFLSHHEGFGFPLVHAMTAGTPVVHSSVSCLPEVAGGAGIACSPTDPDEIARGITRVLTDEAEWTRCQRDGQVRSAHFDWDASAAAHARIFRDVINRASR